MLKSTYITGAIISLVVTTSTAIMIGWGVDHDVAAEIAAGLGSLASIGLTLALYGISKYTILAQPAAIVVAAVESEMGGQAGAAKKEEAITRLKAWIDENIANQFTRIIAKFMADRAIDGIVVAAKKILYTPAPTVAKTKK